MSPHDPSTGRGFGLGGSGSATLGRPAPANPALEAEDGFEVPPHAPPPLAAPGATGLVSPELTRALADVKGQAQFLLYLAEQIEDSLTQLEDEATADPSQAAFLCRMLAMYSNQLEAKHQGLGDRIAETCQEVYVTVREFDMELGHPG